VEIGFNTRMEGVQGAVLSAKLKHLDGWNESRRRHANLYRELLADVDALQLPAAPTPEAHVWHLFVALVNDLPREEFRSRLNDLGVATGVHYPTPVPYQPAYRYLGHQPGDFPVTESVMSRCVSLPMYPELSEEQIRYVADAIWQCAPARRLSVVKA
jgi:dTDP-4-amino-4,6-dideoxygalactose transaminase